MSATPKEVPRKITPPLLLAKKAHHEKIVGLTANDYPLARILDEAGMLPYVENAEPMCCSMGCGN